MANTDDTTTSRKRKVVSRRGFEDAAGNESSIEDAVAATYVVLDGARDVKAFRYSPGTPAGAMSTMCALFGWQTKVGNVVTGRLNDPDNPGSPDDAAADAEAWIDGAESGTWASRDGVGAKIDLDTLCGVMVEMAIEAGKLDANASDFGARKDGLRVKLEEDKKFRNERFAVPAIRGRYNAAKGKAMLSLDDALAAI